MGPIGPGYSRGMRAPLLALLIGCGPKDVPDPTVPDVQPSCALDPHNALRVVCTAEAGPLQLAMVADGAPERHFASDAASITAWGLHPQTEYAWAMAGATGTVSTGPLPDQLAAAELVTTGEPTGFDAVLQALRCTDQWMVMVDGGGTVVWYEPTDVYQSPQDGYEWSAEDQTVLQVGPTRFRALHASGQVTLELDGSDFTGALHHDVSRRAGLTFLLFEEDLDPAWVSDGFHVFDDSEWLGTFRFADHFDPPTTGDGDWTHANGINITEGGTAVISLRNQDQVFAVDADPDSPSFLEILWSVAGNDVPLGRPTFVATDPFDGQHNATFADDRLYLFDNLFEEGVRSRATRYELDVGSGLALLELSWVLPEFCPIQSGVLPVPGGVLTSCATSGSSRLYPLGQDQPTWTLTTECPGTGYTFGAMTRAIPVSYGN